MENNTVEMVELLQEQPEAVVKEISEYNWNVIKKYYDTERFELLFQYLKFVAYTCFIVEYAYSIGLISEESFESKMEIYNNIYEMKRQQS